jgi:hypothetical protein
MLGKQPGTVILSLPAQAGAAKNLNLRICEEL